MTDLREGAGGIANHKGSGACHIFWSRRLIVNQCMENADSLLSGRLSKNPFGRFFDSPRHPYGRAPVTFVFGMVCPFILPTCAMQRAGIPRAKGMEWPNTGKRGWKSPQACAMINMCIKKEAPLFRQLPMAQRVEKVRLRRPFPSVCTVSLSAL